MRGNWKQPDDLRKQIYYNNFFFFYLQTLYIQRDLKRKVNPKKIRIMSKAWAGRTDEKGRRNEKRPLVYQETSKSK